MAFLTLRPSMVSPATSRSSPLSCSASCHLAAIPSRFTVRQRFYHGKPNTRSAKTLAYQGGNCGEGNCGEGYGRGNRFRGGPFQMNPDMMMAGSAIAEMIEMARKWQAANPSSPGFPQGGGNPNPMDALSQLPLPVDLQESDDLYTLTADVPGLQKSDLKITVNQKDRTLTVSGERKRTSDSNPEADNAQDQQKQQFRRQFERRMGKFQRTLSGLPNDADLALVSARVEKGVLTISVKKTEQKKYDDYVEINID